MPCNAPAAPLRRFTAVVFLLLWGFACPSSAPGAVDANSIQQQASAAVDAYVAQSKAVVGLCAVDLRGGETWIDLRPDELLTTASNQKLLTAAVALARLGGEFQFVTAPCRIGDDLWVLGSGDPTFGDPQLAREANTTIYSEMDRWAAVVRKAMPGGIPGDLIVCGAFGANQTSGQESFRHPDWPKAHHHVWYAAPAAALNFNDNCLDVTFRVADGTVTPSIVPQSRFIRAVSRIKLGRRHIWSVQYSQSDSVVTLTGSARTSSLDPISVPVNNPLLLFGRVLADRLARAGVKVNGRIRTIAAAPDGGTVRPLCQTRVGLSRVLRRANKRSLNMAAECVFLRAGDGTWAGSAKIATTTLLKDYGLDANSFVIRDGGGLSRYNRVSPRAMVRLLSAAAGRKDANVLLASLPVSGTDGTMRTRLTAAPYRGRVRAKTGYISGVCCLSGYVCDADGRPAVAFSMLVNRVPPGKAWQAKQLQDSICRMLVDSLEQRRRQADP